MVHALSKVQPEGLLHVFLKSFCIHILTVTWIDCRLNVHIIMHVNPQIITAHRTSSLVTMESAFTMITGVITMMTVEITVTKKDAVCDVMGGNFV